MASVSCGGAPDGDGDNAAAALLEALAPAPDTSADAPTTSSVDEPVVVTAPRTPEVTTAMTSTSHAVIRSDGGSIEVSGDGSALELTAMTTADGWEAAVSRPAAQQLDVTFTRQGQRVEVHIELTANGIRSSLSATSTA